MTRSRGRLVVLALAAALVPSARAQEAAPAEPPGPEPMAITPGFTPDPIELDGRTVGERPLSSIAPGCRGYVGPAPDRVIELRARFGFLRFFVTAEEPVTMALRGPDGRFRCSGRPLHGAPNEEGVFAPGRYEVWIGSLRRGAEVPYQLHVTEFRSVTPRSARGGDELAMGRGDVPLDVAVRRGRFFGPSLDRGFLPDPREGRGEAGGPIDAAVVGGLCRGHVSEQPNHVLELREPFDYFRIEIARSDAPVTLVVRAPSGAFFCSAPDDGEPVVDRPAWEAGTYRIWVGSRTEGATPAYRIRYSETRPHA